MTTREQLEVLQSELGQLRTQFHKTGRLSELQVSALIVRTARLLRESRGGRIEQTVANIHGRLESIRSKLRGEEVIRGR